MGRARAHGRDGHARWLGAGEDATLLAVAAAVEPLLAPTPPPPRHPPCSGCRLRVDTQPVTYAGSGALGEGQTSSCYTFELEGSCALSRATSAA